MNCAETQHLLDAYIDGELDLVRSLEIEQHLQECPTCAAAYKTAQALQAAMRGSSLRFKTPEKLHRVVQASLRQADKTQQRTFMVPWRWLPVVAALAALIVIAWVSLRSMSAPSADDLLAQEVLSSHVRSLMADHLADVASTDQHTVKPWFDGKLDFAPPVIDLADQGFPLLGGRLDYLNNRPVAALVYQRRKHVINLFIWPNSDGLETGIASATRQGYQLFHWSRAGMTYWAVSDVSSSDLSDFAQLIWSQVSPPATP